MGVFRQLTGCSTRAFFAVCGSALVLGPATCAYAGSTASAAQVWNAAVEARLAFEAEPSGTHTRAGYNYAMDGFRAIYHADPADVHAPRAVAEVAELLAEQGREFHDRKSLRAAAGQYEFLAHAYPQSSLAPESLDQAAALLAPQVADDPGELHKVEAELTRSYPAFPRHASGSQPAESAASLPVRNAESQANSTRATAPVSAAAVLPADDVSLPATPDTTVPEGTPAPYAHAPALVSAIRHWSTPSYTRVAIDLGDEVRFQAARVQSPDRIFFDLHHTRLAPQLAGKSFAVTDEGFLTRIRAAQFSDDVTRVVLDVHEIAEYSAFLLPNPYRLIIDIHGRPEGAAVKGNRGPAAEESASMASSETAALPGNAAERKPAQPAKNRGTPSQDTTSSTQDTGTVPSETAKAATPRASEGDHYVPRRQRAAVAAGQPSEAVPLADPTERSAGGGSDAGQGTVPIIRQKAAERSSLPPMPVTDGGGAFGLPTRRSADSSTTSAAVAAPRVVIPSRPTAARPVPNTVATHSAAASTEVAAVSEQPGKVEATLRPTSQPVVDLANRTSPAREGSISRSRKPRSVAGPESPAAPAIAAPPTADGETSLLRALGLKIGRIVIDAGHGGHDSGTLGVDGLEEKDVVLDVALRLGKLLHDRLGAEIVYTRADDTFIPLETRTAIANKAQADLFISVHANSSPDPAARGVEVYYLNFTSDPEAMGVASRENAVSTKSVHELSELVRRITLKDKIEESRELASEVDSSLYAGLSKGSGGLKDRGVKKAPFVVLIGANMPSILAEISFVTNPRDASSLGRPEYRERVAESLYNGVAHYASSINGRRSAESLQRAER